MHLFAVSMAHNLKGLLFFSGKDDRGLFWPYAITVVILIYALSLTVLLPEMQRISANALKDGRMGPPDLTIFIRWTLVFMAITALLLAAAVVRRLRDRGKSPVWALVPLVLTAANFALLGGDPIAILDGPAWALITAYVVNFIGQISIIFLIVLLAGRSRNGQET